MIIVNFSRSRLASRKIRIVSWCNPIRSRFPELFHTEIILTSEFSELLLEMTDCEIGDGLLIHGWDGADGELCGYRGVYGGCLIGAGVGASDSVLQ